MFILLFGPLMNSKLRTRKMSEDPASTPFAPNVRDMFRKQMSVNFLLLHVGSGNAERHKKKEWAVCSGRRRWKRRASQGKNQQYVQDRTDAGTWPGDDGLLLLHVHVHASKESRFEHDGGGMDIPIRIDLSTTKRRFFFSVTSKATSSTVAASPIPRSF